MVAPRHWLVPAADTCGHEGEALTAAGSACVSLGQLLAAGSQVLQADWASTKYKQ